MEDTFICTSKTQSDCKDEFFNANPHLEYHRVDSDGNCFFRSLAEYYQLTGETLRGVRNPTNHEELRAFIVGRFGDMLRRDPELMGFLRLENQRPLGEILSELGRTCVWNVYAFEVMMPQVSTILGINLVIYKVNRPTDYQPYYNVSRSVYTPRNGPAVGTTISVFLALNHYGLVFPRAVPPLSSYAAAQASNSSNSVLKMAMNLHNQNALNDVMAASMNQLKLNDQKRAKNNTRKKAEKNEMNAVMAASMRQLELNKQQRAEKNAMNAAIAASMRQMQLNTQKRNRNRNAALAASMNRMILNSPKKNTKKKMNNYNIEAALAASMNQMRLNNRRRNNENAALAAALAASMKKPNNQPIGLTVENVQGEFPYKSTTVTEIKTVLNAYGVEYPKAAKKEELYSLLMMTLLNLKS